MALFDMPGRVGGLSAEARAGAAMAAKRRAEQRSACDSMILEAKLQQATRQTFAMAMFGDPPSPRPSGAPPARPRRPPSRSRAEIHADSESDASDSTSIRGLLGASSLGAVSRRPVATEATFCCTEGGTVPWTWPRGEKGCPKITPFSAFFVV